MLTKVSIPGFAAADRGHACFRFAVLTKEPLDADLRQHDTGGSRRRLRAHDRG